MEESKISIVSVHQLREFFEKIGEKHGYPDFEALIYYRLSRDDMYERNTKIFRSILKFLGPVVILTMLFMIFFGELNGWRTYNPHISLSFFIPVTLWAYLSKPKLHRNIDWIKANKIEFLQKIIELKKHGNFLPYWEEQLEKYKQKEP